MNPVQVIAAKKAGRELSTEEIRAFVLGYARGEVPDYQAAAWLMAICWRGMTPRETADLTQAMVDSGRCVDLSEFGPLAVDKHSTGGVGDKATLVVAPLVAAVGGCVAKMSGRGLGHTGGTLDKLEAIPGVRVDLDIDGMLAQLRRIGLAIAGQTADLVPADGMLYALRDVTATVDSLPLIASSVMSKKIAGGARGIVLDVKFGAGAFVRTAGQAVELARAMVDIGASAGRSTVAFVSAMDQPLGRAIGNALEVREAIDTLRGDGPADLTELCLALAGEMLVLAGIAADAAEGRARAESALRSGAALEKLGELIEAQGGERAVVRDGRGLPTAPERVLLPATRDGYVVAIDALRVGLCAVSLGAGRSRKGDPVDPAVGVVLERKVGEAVRAGEPLAVVHARTAAEAAAVEGPLRAAFHIAEERPPPQPLLVARVDRAGVANL